MKNKLQYAAGLVTFALLQPAAADIIYSGYQNISIPTNFTGVSLTVDGGMINPFFGGVGVANNANFQPVRAGTGGLDPILNLATGSTVDSSSNYYASGAGGSQSHLGSSSGQFIANTDGYLGMKLSNIDYGWMRMFFTNNTSGAVIKDWAYDNTPGAAISVGNIVQSAPTAGAQTVTLSSDTGKSFTLGTQITNILGNDGGVTNSLIKNGAGIAILTLSNTYSGITAVNAGKLIINGSGSINNSSGTTVAAGARLVYNSSTALTSSISLSGAGTSSRAVLGGAGTIGTSVTLNNFGDTLSPGNSPGIQTFTPAQTWSSFSYDWEVNNFTGTTAGTDFDQLGLNSTLDLTGGSFILNVLSLTASNVGGNVPNFSDINRSWSILTSTGITGFNAANWAINTGGFTDTTTGTWGISQSSNDLVLSYTVVPETNVAALLGGFATLVLLRRRR